MTPRQAFELGRDWERALRAVFLAPTHCEVTVAESSIEPLKRFAEAVQWHMSVVRLSGSNCAEVLLRRGRDGGSWPT
jgi:hypothetical protein